MREIGLQYYLKVYRLNNADALNSSGIAIQDIFDFFKEYRWFFRFYLLATRITNVKVNNPLDRNANVVTKIPISKLDISYRYLDSFISYAYGRNYSFLIASIFSYLVNPNLSLIQSLVVPFSDILPTSIYKVILAIRNLADFLNNLVKFDYSKLGINYAREEIVDIQTEKGKLELQAIQTSYQRVSEVLDIIASNPKFVLNLITDIENIDPFVLVSRLDKSLVLDRLDEVVNELLT